MFLSNAELKELTTYTHRKKQCEQLSKMGYAFTVRPIDGKPLVLASLVEARHGGKGKQRRAAKRGKELPPALHQALTQVATHPDDAERTMKTSSPTP